MHPQSRSWSCWSSPPDYGAFRHFCIRGFGDPNVLILSECASQCFVHGLLYELLSIMSIHLPSILVLHWCCVRSFNLQKVTRQQRKGKNREQELTSRYTQEKTNYSSWATIPVDIKEKTKKKPSRVKINFSPLIRLATHHRPDGHRIRLAL
jgi:hypothetical protein